MDATRRAELLTTVDRAAPVKASILTDGEKRAHAGRMLRRAISSSDLKYAAVSDKDHAQLSREIDGKEKLSFHEMVACWPPAVWVELLPILAVHFGGDVETTIRFRRSA